MFPVLPIAAISAVLITFIIGIHQMKTLTTSWTSEPTEQHTEHGQSTITKPKVRYLGEEVVFQGQLAVHDCSRGGTKRNRVAAGIFNVFGANSCGGDLVCGKFPQLKGLKLQYSERLQISPSQEGWVSCGNNSVLVAMYDFYDGSRQFSPESIKCGRLNAGLAVDRLSCRENGVHLLDLHGNTLDHMWKRLYCRLDQKPDAITAIRTTSRPDGQHLAIRCCRIKPQRVVARRAQLNNTD